jgi:hypothetical protein
MCFSETYSKVRIGKLLPDNFQIQNVLKQRDGLSLLSFNYASEYAIRNIQEHQLGLKLIGTHQPLAYADINLLEGSIALQKKHRNFN